MYAINIILIILSIICIKVSFIKQVRRANKYNNGANNLRKAFMINLFLLFFYLIKLLVDIVIFNEHIYGIFNSIILLIMSISVFFFYQENNFAFLTKNYWIEKFNKKKRD